MAAEQLARAFQIVFTNDPDGSTCTKPEFLLFWRSLIARRFRQLLGRDAEPTRPESQQETWRYAVLDNWWGETTGRLGTWVNPHELFESETALGFGFA